MNTKAYCRTGKILALLITLSMFIAAPLMGCHEEAKDKYKEVGRDLKETTKDLGDAVKKDAKETKKDLKEKADDLKK